MFSIKTIINKKCCGWLFDRWTILFIRIPNFISSTTIFHQSPRTTCKTTPSRHCSVVLLTTLASSSLQMKCFQNNFDCSPFNASHHFHIISSNRPHISESHSPHIPESHSPHIPHLTTLTSRSSPPSHHRISPPSSHRISLTPTRHHISFYIKIVF